MTSRILIIAADPADSTEVSRLLSARGHSPLVPDWASGLGLSDLVLCVLPHGADPSKVLAGLRCGAAPHGVPVLALSALAGEHDRDRLIAAGFDGYIGLPLEADSFVADVEAFLPANANPAPTLLLVDDDDFTLDILSDFLESDGYRVLTAASGDEALEHLAREPVQVVLCDQWMPGMSGTELMAHTRALYPHTVRLVLSAQVESDDIAHAVGQGVVDSFHAKPWTGSALREGIRDAFRLQRERAAAGRG
jgi:two-component system, cell cycle response regulator